LILYSRQSRPRAQKAPVSRSNPVLARRGTALPLGRALIVTAACVGAARGLCDRGPGHLVWFPPGEDHWDGAAPTTAMTHIAIQEALDGKLIDWLERVSDEQFLSDFKTSVVS
jgi:hypothetical protein